MHHASWRKGERELTVRASITQLLEAGANVNAKDIDERTPLHIAVCNSNCWLTDQLMSCGADPNARDYRDRTPIFSAYRSAIVTKMLIDHGADVNVRDSSGWTPLLHFLRKEGTNFDAVRLLLEAGANTNATAVSGGTTPLQMTFRMNVMFMKLLIDYGADVNMRDGDGWTPLFTLLNRKDTCVDAVHLLIEAGADVHARVVTGGMTALHMSCRNDVRIMKLLIENGANVNTMGGGVRPIHLAASGVGGVERIRLLLKAGADASALDARKKNALHYAMCGPGQRVVMQVLFDAGVDAKAIDDEEMTPMHELFAQRKPPGGNRAVISKTRMLIENGANINAKDKRGRTPLFARFAVELNDALEVYLTEYQRNAINERRRELWTSIVEKGAQLNVVAPVARYNTSRERIEQFGLLTFAHFAILYDDAELLETAIAHGVDLNVRSLRFGSALHMACFRNDSALAKMLYENGAHDDIVSQCL